MWQNKMAINSRPVSTWPNKKIIWRIYEEKNELKPLEVLKKNSNERKLFGFIEWLSITVTTNLGGIYLH
jgi:hypothetical protein